MILRLYLRTWGRFAFAVGFAVCYVLAPAFHGAQRAFDRYDDQQLRDAKPWLP